MKNDYNREEMDFIIDGQNIEDSFIIKLHLLKMKHSLTYLIVQIYLFLKMLIMYIFVRTILFTEPNSTPFPIQRVKH